MAKAAVAVGKVVAVVGLEVEAGRGPATTPTSATPITPTTKGTQGLTRGTQIMPLSAAIPIR